MGPELYRREREDKVKTLVAFAADLEKTLRSNELPSTLVATIYKQCDRVLLLQGAGVVNSTHDLDARGTRLWNLASKLKHRNSAITELICLVRVFACLLLDCAQRSSQGSVANDIRVFRSTLRSTKHCLEQRQLSLAERVIERAAIYEARLAGLGKRGNEEQLHHIRHLSQEYFVLRITLAWRQDRVDLAELMVPKVCLDSAQVDPSTAESIADLYYEIGRDQTSRSRPAEATKWLTRAHEVLSGRDLEELSSDASELQVSVMHSMVKALISLGGQEQIAKAWNILGELELGHGDRLAVLLLRLDLYSLDAVYPTQDYCDVLQRIIRTVHLTDSNVKTALHHIHKLRTRNARMAHMVLVTLAIERLVGVEEYQWLEKTLITIVWNCTSSAELTDTLGLLSDFLETLHSNIGRAMSPSATHAAQILMCKRIDTSYNQEQYDSAQSWCRLSLHPIFSNSGTLNTGKLQRKLILCALGMSDSQRAREVYLEMSDMNKKHPSTQYLLYKIALRCQDVELATQCLDTICCTSTKDATLLYACVLEAQRAGDRAQSIASMQRVLDKYDYGAPGGVHLPALLRCTARMLIQELDNATPGSQHNTEGLCKLFDGAANQAKTSRRDSKDEVFSLAELDWFSRNSYNLALRVCSEWNPQQTLGLVSACLKFMELYPSDMDPDVLADLSLRRLFCDFLCASLLTVIAREEDNIEMQLQHYLNVRKAANDFRSRLQEQLERLEGGAKEDLLHKHKSLLAYDFEAAARLKAWESFEPLIKDCDENPDPKIYAIMADIVLSCEAPTAVQITTLQQIVHATWSLSNTNITNLSRWIRCLFSLSLTSSSSGSEMSEHLLSQVVTITNSAKTTPHPYPAEELEYLATTTFNRAVDFYCASQDAACRRWAGKALEIAELCEDGGALRELLMEKFGRLSWDGVNDGGGK